MHLGHSLALSLALSSLSGSHMPVVGPGCVERILPCFWSKRRAFRKKECTEAFLQAPLHMLRNVRPASRHGHVAAAAPVCPALLLLRV